MEDEKDILRRMSSGDSDAFRLVFLKYAPRVEAFAMKMLKNIHEAQDVSQNIFTKLWMQRRELAQVQSLNAYLFRMTRNAVLDICKHSRIRMQFENSARVDGQILCDDVTERIDTAELSRQIEAAVSKIPMGRLGTCEDIGYAVVYLASDEANYVTGACLDVNGGIYMRS